MEEYANMDHILMYSSVSMKKEIQSL